MCSSDLWDQTRHALEFFRNHLPFWEMVPQSARVEPAGARVLAKTGQAYAIQLPKGGSPVLELPPGAYSVQWYDPRSGGAMKAGSVPTVSGGGMAKLGAPPSDPAKDWVVLVKRRGD